MTLLGDEHDEDIGRPRRIVMLAGAAIAVLATLTILRLAGGAFDGADSTDPPDLFGDPVSVTAAMAARDSDHGDRELVVAGYLSPTPMLSCPAAFPFGDDNPTRLRCPQTFQWLMEQPERVMTVGPNSFSGGSPSGPSFHPSFAIVDEPLVPIPAQGPVAPLGVTLVGHFHDRRAARCDPQDQAECDGTFIVDRVLAVDGVERPVATRRAADGQSKASEADIDGLVLGVAPGRAVLSRVLVTSDGLAGIEPALRGAALAGGQHLVWLVTVLDRVDRVPIARTVLIVDGDVGVREVTADGLVQPGAS